MPDELRPPPEYTHLRWHWLEHKIRELIVPYSWRSIEWKSEFLEQWRHGDGQPISPKAMVDFGWNYHSPATPLPGDDAAQRTVKPTPREPTREMAAATKGAIRRFNHSLPEDETAEVSMFPAIYWRAMWDAAPALALVAGDALTLALEEFEKRYGRLPEGWYRRAESNEIDALRATIASHAAEIERLKALVFRALAAREFDGPVSDLEFQEIHEAIMNRAALGKKGDDHGDS